MTVGEALVALLHDYGVTHVFGIPGTHSLELYRGLANSSIRQVAPRHEQGAGFMADGYARVSGNPGVCFVITGPGVTNLTTAIAEAHQDSVPMLVISPVNPPLDTGTNAGRLHEITDQSAVTAPITAFSATVHDADEIPGLVAAAFEMFQSKRPRPVHINIPLPILATAVNGAWTATPPYALPLADEDLVDEAAGQLLAARQPIIVAGGGARHASTHLTRLAELLGAPLLTTVAGRGVIPGSHPLCPGAQLREPNVQALLGEADLALVVGSQLAEPDHYADLPLPADQIRINIDANSLPRAFGILNLKCDAATTIAALLEQCATQTARSNSWGVQACRRARDNLDRDLTEETRLHLAVLNALKKELPGDAIIVSDMTRIAYTAVSRLPIEHAGSWLHPTGYGTLGYAMPAAIGAKLAAPARKVIAIAGDSGFQYTGQEMTLARELGLDLIVLLWNNEGLKQIREDMTDAGFEPLAVEPRNPDFIQWAQACGWHADNPADLESFGVCLRAALQTADQPTLIELREDAIADAV